MVTTKTEMKEQNVQGEFSTAEVTHLIKAVQLEGLLYLQNHLRMRLSGNQGVIREVHDNLTRPNIERLTGMIGNMGVPLPFTMPLEERENEIKAKLQGTNVEGTLTEGEVIAATLADIDQLAMFYTVSMNLANHTDVIDVFRRNLQTIIDQKPRVMDSFRQTKEYVVPPVAQKVQLVGALSKGVTASTTRRG